MLMSEINFSENELKKLSELLRYAYDAMEYWFSGCDVDEETLQENASKKLDCEYFIKKIDKLT